MTGIVYSIPLATYTVLYIYIYFICLRLVPARNLLHSDLRRASASVRFAKADDRSPKSPGRSWWHRGDGTRWKARKAGTPKGRSGAMDFLGKWMSTRPFWFPSFSKQMNQGSHKSFRHWQWHKQVSLEILRSTKYDRLQSLSKVLAPPPREVL